MRSLAALRSRQIPKEARLGWIRRLRGELVVDQQAAGARSDLGLFNLYSRHVGILSDMIASEL